MLSGGLWLLVGGRCWRYRAVDNAAREPCLDSEEVVGAVAAEHREEDAVAEVMPAESTYI